MASLWFILFVVSVLVIGATGFCLFKNNKEYNKLHKEYWDYRTKSAVVKPTRSLGFDNREDAVNFISGIAKYFDNTKFEYEYYADGRVVLRINKDWYERLQELINRETMLERVSGD